MERTKIGTITKPQALKGEFRVKPTLLNLKDYKKISCVYISNSEYAVEKVSLRDTFVIFKIKGVDSCEQAEILRNKEIFADMDVKFEEPLDLVGYTAYVLNEEIGPIVDINNFGSKDILSISGKHSIMLPVIDGLISSVSDKEKKVVFEENLFNQVAVYED